MAINHDHQQSRFHTRGRTSEAEGELHLERKGLPRPQKVSKRRYKATGLIEIQASNEKESLKCKAQQSIKAHSEGQAHRVVLKDCTPCFLLDTETHNASPHLTCAVLL